ncbi:MAG TPA: hypothetical protein VMB34_16680 [Acetobacteraceae bacterium]|nr:hypothetical protein [Acetobacteraceae bacterium]
MAPEEDIKLDSAKLHVGEKRGEQIQSGEKDFIASRALTFDIDEVLPVGDAGIKPQRAVDRALSAYNRQLLDPNTNQRTKKLGIDLRDLLRNRGEYEPISVAGNPSALITRRFSEVVELKRIFDQAVASVNNKGRYRPTELKKRINREVRRIIAEGKGNDAVAVREALAQIGFKYIAGQGYVMINTP